MMYCVMTSRSRFVISWNSRPITTMLLSPSTADDQMTRHRAFTFNYTSPIHSPEHPPEQQAA